MVARFLLMVLLLLVPAAILAPGVAAQGSDTVYDEAGALSDSEEQQVQEVFDQTEEEAGQPLYAFLVPDTGVESQEAQRDLLTQEAREEDVPQDAGVIVVAPNDLWAQAAYVDGVSEDAVYEAMVPDFEEEDYAAGLVAGAAEIQGEPVAQGAQSDAGGVPAGGILLLLALLAGVAVLLRTRRRNRQRLEDDRRVAEEEFSNLTSRINEFD